MNKDGYPDKRELNYIENFNPYKKHPIELFKYIKDRWWPDFGKEQKDDLYYFTIDEREEEYSDQKVYHIEFSTCGWSGNEDLISSLEDNKYFINSFFKVEWHRGGHYIYEVPVEWLTNKKKIIDGKAGKRI
jgi:hypothetical protein